MAHGPMPHFAPARHIFYGVYYTDNTYCTYYTYYTYYTYLERGTRFLGSLSRRSLARPAQLPG